MRRFNIFSLQQPKLVINTYIKDSPPFSLFVVFKHGHDDRVTCKSKLEVYWKKNQVACLIGHFDSNVMQK